MPFQPYSIVCTTCASQLKVGDESLIGAIVTCPKCDSMVQVTAPDDYEQPNQHAQSHDPTEPDDHKQAGLQGNVAMGAAPVDSEAITEDGISASSFSREADIGTSGPATDDVFRSPPGPVPPNTDDETSASGPPPIAAGEEGGALPPMEFQSDQTRRTRHFVMVAMLSVSLLCVAGLLFGMFVRSQRSANTETEPNQDATVEDATAESVIDPTGNKSDGDLTDGESSDGNLDNGDPNDGDPSEGNPSELELPPSETEAANQPPQTEQDPSPATTSDESTTPADSEMETKVAEVTDSGESEFLKSLIPDPLGSREDEVAPADEPQMEDLPESLKQFTPFLLQEDPQPKTTLEPLQTLDDVEIDSAEEEASELGIEPARKLNLRSDLATRIAMRSDTATFPHLVLTFSQITNVPIQIDWASFDLGGISIEQPLKISGKTRPVGKWIDQVAALVDAEVVPHETWLTITPTDAAFGPRRDAILDLSDFADPSSASKVLDSFLQEFDDDETEGSIEETNPADAEMGAEIDAADEKAGGKGADGLVDLRRLAMKMEPRQKDLLRVLATEMLRRMRGINGKLPDEVIRRWGQVEAGDSTQWKKLQDGKQTIDFDFPVAAIGILKRTAKANDAWCFINWENANRRGLRPGRLVLPTQADTAQSLLTEVLEPHSLQVRTVDANHWWVGSGSTYDRLPVLIQTPSLGNQRDRFQDQVDRIMAGADRTTYRRVYDPVSDRLLMMVPRFIARQLPKIKSEPTPPLANR